MEYGLFSRQGLYNAYPENMIRLFFDHILFLDNMIFISRKFQRTQEQLIKIILETITSIFNKNGSENSKAQTKKHLFRQFHIAVLSDFDNWTEHNYYLLNPIEIMQNYMCLYTLSGKMTLHPVYSGSFHTEHRSFALMNSVLLPCFLSLTT